MMTSDTTCKRVIAAHQGTHIFGIECCGLRHIGKEDGHEPAFFGFAQRLRRGRDCILARR
jgi:hypothetical protein